MEKANTSASFLEKIQVNEPFEIAQLLEFHQGIRSAVESFKRNGFPTIVWHNDGDKTLSDAFQELCSAFDKLSENIYNYGKGVGTNAETQIENVQSSCKESQQLIAEILSICEKVSQYDKQFTTMLSDQGELTISVYRMVSELTGSAEPSAKDIKNLQKCFEKIQAARNSTMQTKTALIHNIQMLIDLYRVKTTEFTKTITKRRSDIVNAMKWSGETFVNFGKEMKQEGEELKKKASDLFFAGDFTDFIKSKCIARLDTESKPFEKFDTSHAAFKDFHIDAATEEDKLPLPVAFGKIIENFTPENSSLNQMKCQSGSFVYMMENNKGSNWCLIMDPLTTDEGFIPSSCVSPIGIGIGVVAREGSSISPVRAGNIVAIIDNSDEHDYTIMDIRGRSCTMRKDCVAAVTSLASSF